ncbi:expressed protein [Phakopsora pachyrhizi]|uniref:Expressed protein n=1 Tax=Phakopsora pachyrhizi TaxID=170000 RepID=A0AAV0ADH1_PHAPC|nr:expressed protein [Phakopsora pachyrhizi]
MQIFRPVFVLCFSSYLGTSYSSITIAGHGGTSFAHFAGQASKKLPAHELKAAGSLTKSDSEIKALGDASKLRAKKSSGRIRVTLGDLIVGDNDRPNLNLVTFRKGTATIVEMRKAARLKMALIKLSRSLSSSVKRALSLPKNMPRKLASKRVKVNFFHKKPSAKGTKLNTSLNKQTSWEAKRTAMPKGKNGAELRKTFQNLYSSNYPNTSNASTRKEIFGSARHMYYKPPQSPKIGSKASQPKALQEALDLNDSLRREENFVLKNPAKKSKAGAEDFGNLREAQINKASLKKPLKSYELTKPAKAKKFYNTQKNMAPISKSFDFSPLSQVEPHMKRVESFEFPILEAPQEQNKSPKYFGMLR